MALLKALERALERFDRFLCRRKARRIRQNAAEDAAEFDRWRGIFEANPGLHARIILRGQRFRHYLLTEDLARVVAPSVTETEIKSKFN